MNQVTESGLLT